MEFHFESDVSEVYCEKHKPFSLAKEIEKSEK
jgi:hypothetical protein